MPALEKNKNAQKYDAEATSFLHIRTPPKFKAAWVRAANRAGKKLAEWVTEALNREAKNE